MYCKLMKNFLVEFDTQHLTCLPISHIEIIMQSYLYSWYQTRVCLQPWDLKGSYDWKQLPTMDTPSALSTTDKNRNVHYDFSLSLSLSLPPSPLQLLTQQSISIRSKLNEQLNKLQSKHSAEIELLEDIKNFTRQRAEIEKQCATVC